MNQVYKICAQRYWRAGQMDWNGYLKDRFCAIYIRFSFCLDAKRNKKVKGFRLAATGDCLAQKGIFSLPFVYFFVRSNATHSKISLDQEKNPYFLISSAPNAASLLKSLDFARNLWRREKNSSLLRRASNSFSLHPPPISQNRDFNKAHALRPKSQICNFE